MDNQKEEILQKIEEAEYVLVGLGQEFDMEFSCKAEKITAESGNSYNSRMYFGSCHMWKHSFESNICRRWKQRSKRDCRSWQKYWKKELFCGFIFHES